VWTYPLLREGSDLPMRMASREVPDWLHVGAALLCFCGVFLLLAQSSFDLQGEADAGSQLTKGFEILRGRHPFVEIDSSVYGPAIFYLSALAQKLEGQRVISEVVVIFGGYLVAYALLFTTFLRRTRLRTLYWLFVVACLLTFPRFHKYHVVLPPAIFLACLSCATRAASPYTKGVWLGMGSAIAGLFRLDFGAYCIVASVVLIWFEARDNPGSAWKQSALAMFSSGVLIVSPWIIFLLTSLEPMLLLTRVVDTTIGVYSGLSRTLPAYTDDRSPLADTNLFVVAYWLLKVAPFLALAGSNRIRAWVGSYSSERATFAAAAAVAAALFFLQASHRIDASHVRQVFPPLAFVALLVADEMIVWRDSLKTFFGITCAAIMVVAICFATGVFVTPGIFARSNYSVDRIDAVINSWQLTKAQVITHQANVGGNSISAVLGRVRSLTDPRDPVLFLPYSAQAYYFADRGFETPFGWLNPGRFARGRSEEEFIRSMDRTQIVVDEPTFAFDGLDARNMRRYAAHLSSFIYETYGIFEVAGPYVLLSKSPHIIETEGRFSLRLVRADESSPSVDRSRFRLAEDGSQHCGVVRSVNTLPAQANELPHQMPFGAGLLLDLDDCGTQRDLDECGAIAIENPRGIYVVSDMAGRPRRVSDISARDLIDTRAVAPGLYEIARLQSVGCARSNQALARAVSTGVSITIEPRRDTATPLRPYEQGPR
jgi:hypothetical protein